MTSLETLLKAISAKLDSVNAKADSLGQSHQQISGQMQTLETRHRFPPANQRWEIVLAGEGILDRETGLVWERSPGNSSLTWDAAKHHCRNIRTGGRHGWRMPAIEELLSLYSSEPNFPFTNLGRSKFWSSTTGYQTEGHTEALLVTATPWINPTQGQSTGTKERVWCVRGGFAGLP